MSPVIREERIQTAAKCSLTFVTAVMRTDEHGSFTEECWRETGSIRRRWKEGPVERPLWGRWRFPRS